MTFDNVVAVVVADWKVIWTFACPIDAVGGVVLSVVVGLVWSAKAATAASNENARELFRAKHIVTGQRFVVAPKSCRLAL